MSCYYSKKALAKLGEQQDRIAGKCADLRTRFIIHPFEQTRAGEHARHGFCRRFGMLARNIDFVFETLPPELDEIPEQEKVHDATSAIHSFVLNTFGCLDNLAWIWVEERRIRNEDGSELLPRHVGLGKEYKTVRKSLSKGFRAYLESREVWFQHLKGFRDALAHRIPLYIPPHVVSTDHVEEYNRLDQAWHDALARGNHDECDRIEAQQRPLTFFRPWMTHSIAEKAKVVPFHRQLIINFLTIEEAATKFLSEL